MPINNIELWAAHFLLILTRMSGIFIISPIFGRGNTPAMLKVGAALCTSLILINILPAYSSELPNTILGFGVTVLTELAVGFIIGYINTMFFSVVFTAGQIIDMQIGFGMVQVFDIQTNTQVPIVGSLLNLVLLETFLLSNGHLRLLGLLFNTFEIIPLGQVSINPELGMFILEAFVVSFMLAIQIAVPTIASGLLAEIGLGMMVRTAPQMNIFVLGVPIKLVIGIIVLFLIIPVFTGVTGNIFEVMFEYIEGTFDGLTAASV